MQSALHISQNAFASRRCLNSSHPVPASGTGPSRLSRRVVVKTAHVPFDAQTSSDDEGNSAGRCPFLAGLRTPPMVDLPWHKRIAMQVFDPAKFQNYILAQRGQDTVIQGPKQPGFAGFYMPANMELSKAIFAEEGSGTITQGLAEQGGFRAFATLLGEDNLLVVKNPKRHTYLRTLLQPAFSADAVATYLPDIQALVAGHLASWEAAGQDGIKAYKALKMLTFDFIMQVVMGRSIPEEQLHHLSDLFNTLISGLVAWPYLDIPFTPYNRALRASRELVSFFQAGLDAVRQQAAAGQQVPGLLGRLVAAVDEEGNRLTDKEICDNLLLVLLAGHDTSSTTLTRVVSNLQDHPEVLQKLRDEQAAVAAKRGEQISAAALKDMPYADAVIRETLRRDPVVGAVVRVATRDFKLGNYGVPAGQGVLVPLRYLAEHDPRWEGKTGELDPAVFNPDRMSTPEGAKPGQLMPFGGGVRYCLGAGLAMAEMKIFLALLARSYTFEADNNTAWKPALGYYPENGLPLVLKKLA